MPVGNLSEAFLHEADDLGVGRPALHTEGLLLDRCTTIRRFFVATGSPLAQAETLRWTDLQKRPVIGSFSDPYWIPLFEELAARLYGGAAD